MPTIHWFFSEGTTRSLANYVLMQPLAERLRPVFPDAAYWDGQSRTVPLFTARSPTPGLLHLLGAPAAGWTLRFWPVVTDELLAPTAGAGTPSMLDQQRSELPINPAAEAYARDQKVVNKRDPSGMAEIVRWMLAVQIEPDDAIFIESTAGLRPFQTALTLGASLLRAVNPEVKVLATGYGELGNLWLRRDSYLFSTLTNMNGDEQKLAEPPPKSKDRVRFDQGEDQLSVIDDLTDLLQLPAWAAAAAGLQRRLDLTALTDLARAGLTEAADLAVSLEKVQHSLDLAWPDDLDREWVELDAALRGAAVNVHQDPAQAAVIDLLQRTLNELTGDSAARQPAVLNLARVELHLRFAERLVAARRFGAALRVLREVMVSREVLGGRDQITTAVGAEKEAAKRRAAAEARLHRGHAYIALWKELSELRNSVAHVNQARKPGDEALKAVVDAMQAEGQAALVSRVRDAVNDAGAWSGAAEGTVGQLALCAWAKSSGSPPDDALRRKIEAAITTVEAKLSSGEPPRPSESLGLEATSRAQADLAVVELSAKSSPSLPGKNQATGKVDKILEKSSARHAIFCGAWPPTAQLAYLRAFEARGLLCWALGEDQQQLHALFDRGVLEWMRDLPAGG